MKIETPIAAEAPLQPVDTFFSAGDARSDRWRELNAAATAWASANNSGAGRTRWSLRVFEELSPFEDYWSYPGTRPHAFAEGKP